MRVFVFGDSITQGFVDSHGGWVARLIRNYNKNIIHDINADWIEVFNLGVSGDTTAGLLSRLDSEVMSRQLYPETEVIVIAIGTNDTIFRGNEYESTTKIFHQQLTKILNKAKVITPRVIFVGMCGVDDMLSNPWKYSSSGKCMSMERIESFEKVLRDFCDEQEVPIVRILEKFDTSMYFDGIHPNDEGHELIYESVKREIDKLQE